MLYNTFEAKCQLKNAGGEIFFFARTAASGLMGDRAAFYLPREVTSDSIDPHFGQNA
jgi:hypothetical protein